MNDDIAIQMLALLNEWWHTEEIDDEIMKAKVVLIFKKGDKEDLGNYRPISLLNTIYKMLAAILQKRVATGIDKHMQKTQYGFRQKRGTAEALHYVRRMIEKGEAMTNKTLLVLLDWAKAFDKIDHDQLINALQRMNIPGKIINLIKVFYRNPEF